MYSVVLSFHNLLRWAVLLLVAVMAIRCWRRAFSTDEWRLADSMVGRITVVVMDVQLTLGILLYAFLSPVTRTVFSDFGAAMRTRALRFYAVEHILLMMLAIAFGHVGWVLIRRTEDSTRKFRRGALWFTLALICFLFGMPWDRALPRGF